MQLIPEGEFAESAFIWVNGLDNKPKVICRPWDKKSTAAPAPTLQEILEELHKLQEDVFLNWSEHAYNEWQVNAYTHNKEDYQAHDISLQTAAMKVWLNLKGIKYE